MSFQPVVPFGGFAGWSFLERTRDAQQGAFDRSTSIQRSTDAFRERIGSITTAEQLVNDRQLLSVALGAFGLDEDIGNRFFIRKVLDEGTVNDQSFANRLSDKRYFELSKAFGFDLTPPNTQISTFADDIVDRFKGRQFEIAVGETAPDIRLVLSLERELPQIASRSLSEDGKWFTIMSTPPLRTVFERAFNLPSSVGALDIDQQLSIFKERATVWFGEEGVSQFADRERIDELTRRFFASSESQNGPSSSTRGSAALALLQSSPGPVGFSALS